MVSFGTEGIIEQIFIASYSGEPMQAVASVEAVSDGGLRGDRYLERTGYWSGVDECQVTLVEGEILDRIVEDAGVPMWEGQHRRNIVTRGVRLHQLLGRQFSIGTVLLEFCRSRPPCAHLQSLALPGTARALFGQRGGIGARVVKSGLVRIHDSIRVLTTNLSLSLNLNPNLDLGRNPVVGSKGRD